jgi:hypothetical protein
LKPLLIKTELGSTVFLDASGSWDPDAGDTLKFRWMQYSKPSCTRWTVRYAVPSLRIEDVSSGLPKMAKVAVKLPARDDGLVSPLDARNYVHWGPMTYHLVLEVVDNRVHPMRAYRQVLLQVGSPSWISKCQ